MRNNKDVSKMIEYMNKKYDDNFSYLIPFGGGPGITSTQIIVKSDKFPDAKIWVEYNMEEGKEYFADNYVEHKFEQQTKDTLVEILIKVFDCDVKVNYSISTIGMYNSFTDKTTFNEFLINLDSQIGFRAFITNKYVMKNQEIIENKFETSIQGEKIIAFGTIYFAEEENQYLDAFELPYKILDTLPSIQFDMNKTDFYINFEWRNCE